MISRTETAGNQRYTPRALMVEIDDRAGQRLDNFLLSQLKGVTHESIAWFEGGPCKQAQTGVLPFGRGRCE